MGLSSLAPIPPARGGLCSAQAVRSARRSLPRLLTLPAGLCLQVSDLMLASLGPWVSTPGRCGQGWG